MRVGLHRPRDRAATHTGDAPLTLAPGLGAPAPVGRPRRRSVWRRRGGVLCIAVGLAAAAGGADLARSPGPVRVWLDAAGYHVDDAVLSPIGDGTWSNGAIVRIVAPPSGGRDAVGSATIDGRHAALRCHQDDRSESCTVTLAGDRVLAAIDTLGNDGHSLWWDRRYEDGVTVRIALPSGPVPVPLALGR